MRSKQGVALFHACRCLLLGTVLLMLNCGISLASDRVWVELPRASRVESIRNDLDSAPLANARARERRRSKGRPQIVERLGRGPSAEALQRLRDTGVRIHYVSRWLSRASVEIDAISLRQLRHAFPSARITPVRSWRRPLPRVSELATPRTLAKLSSGEYGPSLLQNQQIQTDQLQAMGFTGAGVRVLILDTGFLTSHMAFPRLKVVDQWDFVWGDSVTANEAPDVPGQHRHGTGVLGIVAGYAPGSLIGPAYDAEYLLAKTEKIDTETRVEEDNFVAALEWGEALGADMVTASLGYLDFPDEPDSFFYTTAQLDGDTGVTTRAMDDVVALGVVALSAVGNSGANGPTSLITPADGDSVLAIGSVKADSTVSFFSSRGPTADGRIKPDLMARGSLTTWAEADSTFSQAFGTSLATPLAAGAIALVLQSHPEWGPGEVMNALKSTSSQSTSPDNDHGWGIIQARDAAFDVMDPVYPLAFELDSPADSTEILGVPVEFRWRAAKDLQGPIADYEIQLSESPLFNSLVATYSASQDTARSLDFLPAGAVHWRVVAFDGEGHARISASRLLTISAPTAVGGPPSPDFARLGVPRPNPFNPRVHLSLRLEEGAHVEADLFDVAGRRIRRLFAGSLPPGLQEWIWDGTDDREKPVGSGVYLLRLQATSSRGASTSLRRRMVLVR